MPRLQQLVKPLTPSESLTLVAHAGVNRVILSHALSLPLENMFRLDQNYGCLNIIDYFPRHGRGAPVKRRRQRILRCFFEGGGQGSADPCPLVS